MNPEKYNLAYNCAHSVISNIKSVNAIKTGFIPMLSQADKGIFRGLLYVSISYPGIKIVDSAFDSSSNDLATFSHLDNTRSSQILLLS